MAWCRQTWNVSTEWMLNQIFVANGEASMRLWLDGFIALYDATLHKDHMIPTNHWKKAKMIKKTVSQFKLV